MKLARIAARVSQKQLAEACGVSQSAISRLEGRGAASYNMTLLARAATHLRIPPRLVGLADHTAADAARVDGTEVERRNFLAGAAAVVTAPVLAAPPGNDAHPSGGHTATLRLATTAFRRMEGSTPSRHLTEPVLAHLRLTQTLAAETENKSRARLAAVGSEIASLAGWLAWDMGDHGSARTWYGTAIKAAHSARDPLLSAYQLGSFAQFEAHAGNGAHALRLVEAARKRLGARRPAIADAWLCTAEALAHASVGDSEGADQALTTAAHLTDSVADEESPPWPWVFSFTHAKVAASRVSCGARLGLPRWVFDAQDGAGSVMAAGHEKQRALLLLDLAFAHLTAGRLDGAFTLGTQALETGLRFRSGRVVDRARALRRACTSPTPPRIVREFDERLHEVYL
ncbi:helix-turn-helix domain-containing protein [Streptomyces capparidis]